MKIRAYVFIILLLILCNTVQGQITEGEKNLRTQSADTTIGWKKGGIIAINLAQTSLTNWAAGGQKSMAVNGIFSRLSGAVQGDFWSWIFL